MSIPQAAIHAAGEFARSAVLDLEPLGRGLINDTFLVATVSRRFVLQRLNARVFKDPAAVMANLRTLLDHARDQPATSDWRLPELIATRSGEDFFRDDQGDCWRALSFIEGARTVAALADADQAQQVGLALGRFHALAAGLDPESMQDTLPGFHLAPAYLARFDSVAGRHPGSDRAEPCAALEFVAARRPCFEVLEQAKRRGQLRVRIIHGDPKLDNILFDAQGRAISLIDLDTVKPGLIHYDLGDCLRSCCNHAGEQGRQVVFDLKLCRAILQGYLEMARGFMTHTEREYLYDAIHLLPLELGLRFLTDHLEGDVYFKVAEPGLNLRRAEVQFLLVESIERQEGDIRRLLADLG